VLVVTGRRVGCCVAAYSSLVVLIASFWLEEEAMVYRCRRQRVGGSESDEILSWTLPAFYKMYQDG
jgi:hypothetical protein